MCVCFVWYHMDQDHAAGLRSVFGGFRFGCVCTTRIFCRTVSCGCGRSVYSDGRSFEASWTSYKTKNMIHLSETGVVRPFDIAYVSSRQ